MVQLYFDTFVSVGEEKMKSIFWFWQENILRLLCKIQNFQQTNTVKPIGKSYKFGYTYVNLQWNL